MNRDRGVWAAAVCVSAAAALLVPRASSAEEGAAEADATERARELFREGVALSDRRQWEDAAERFRQALELRDAPAIRYNLAATLVQLGRDAEAAEELDVVLSGAETPEDLRGQAQSLLEQVEPRIGRLEVAAEGFESGVTVSLDGEALGRERLARPLRVSAGSHVVTAEADGEEVGREEVLVEAGGSAAVVLVPPRSDADQAIVDAAAGGAEEGPEETPLIRDWRLWLGVGVGVAVVIAAVAVGVAVGTGGVEDPVAGNMDPGVLTWR